MQRTSRAHDDLPAGWGAADVVVHVEAGDDADRAAMILGPLSPGRAGRSFRVTISPGGRDGASVDAVKRVLDRLESEGIDARITVPDGAVHVVPAPAEVAPNALAAAWDEAVSDLPPDWSDLYVEVELASSDEIERAALLSSPVNPFLVERGRPALRFRAARRRSSPSRAICLPSQASRTRRCGSSFTSQSGAAACACASRTLTATARSPCASFTWTVVPSPFRARRRSRFRAAPRSRAPSRSTRRRRSRRPA